MKSVFVGEFDLLDSHVKSPCFPFTSYRDQFLEYISVQKGHLFAGDIGFMKLVDTIYSNNYLHCRDQMAGFDFGLTHKPTVRKHFYSYQPQVLRR